MLVIIDYTLINYYTDVVLRYASSNCYQIFLNKLSSSNPVCAFVHK